MDFAIRLNLTMGKWFFGRIQITEEVLSILLINFFFFFFGRGGVRWNEFRACTCYNQLQKHLRHCTVFWHKWPVHDPVLLIPPPPLIKVASNTRPYSKLGGTTLNGREEGGQYYILQTCDQERFEARKVVFLWECLNIFATGCSYSLPKWQAVKLTFFSPWGKLSFEFPFIDLIHPFFSLLFLHFLQTFNNLSDL